MADRKKLLVVVDMQNDFVTGCLGTKEAQSIVVPIAEYVKRFNGDVVYTRDTHGSDYMDTQEGKRLPVAHCIDGTDGWQLVPELQELQQKYMNNVFDKPAFGSTELAGYITGKGYDQIQFCGVCTGICVISNAVMAKAFLPEAEIQIIANMCACVTAESHATALSAMATLQMDIVTVNPEDMGME